MTRSAITNRTMISTPAIGRDNFLACLRDLRSEAAEAGDARTVADCDLVLAEVAETAGPRAIWSDVETLSGHAMAAARRCGDVIDAR